MTKSQARVFLERRKAWVDDRIAQKKHYGGESYDREESSALKMAILALARWENENVLGDDE